MKNHLQFKKHHLQWIIFPVFFCLFIIFFYCLFLRPIQNQLKEARQTEQILKKQIQIQNQKILKQSICLEKLNTQIKTIAFFDANQFKRHIVQFCKYVHFKTLFIKLTMKPPLIQANIELRGKINYLKKLLAKLNHSRIALKSFNLTPIERNNYQIHLTLIGFIQ